MPGNPFQALDDEDDGGQAGVKAPEEPPKVLKPTQAPAQTQAAPKTSKPKEQAPAQQQQQQPAQQQQQQQQQGGRPAGGNRESRPPRQNLPPRQRPPRAPQGEGAAPQGDVESAASEKPQQRDHGVRPRSNRGGREGSSYRNERHSHHRQQKASGKDGHGAGNWGSTKEVVSDVVGEEKAAEEAETAAPPAAEEPAATTAASEATPEAPKEEEGPKELTLEEYRKAQKKSAAHSLPAARKAGEGEDTSKWSTAQELVKEEGDDGADKNGSDRKSQRAFKKQTLDIDVNVVPIESKGEGREGGFRGGRGGGRGGRGGPGRGGRGGRGGERGDRPPRSSGQRTDSKGAVPFTASEKDFPSLSA